jgi:hypothetical protein
MHAWVGSTGPAQRPSTVNASPRDDCSVAHDRKMKRTACQGSPARRRLVESADDERAAFGPPFCCACGQHLWLTRRKSACASPSRRLCRKPQDYVGIALPAASHRPKLRDHASWKPDKALASLIGLCEADAFDRHCDGNGVKRLLGDGDLDHVGAIGSARASRQNSPRAREVSNAGATHFAGQDSKGTPSRLGAPARLFR